MKQWKTRDLLTADDGHSLPGDLPLASVKVLLARGIETSQQLTFFLQPPHRLPHSPFRLSGMEQAVQRLSKVARNGTANASTGRVGIVGDFDVDGITGTAILAEGLASFGMETVPYLPHRVAEGHGLSEEAVRHLAGENVELIVTVDCGVSSIRETELANGLGMDVIITDHHIPPANPPAATAIIDPAIPGNEYPFPHLCGAGLALKLMQGLYQLHGQQLPPGLLELAALGTIADMVPLLDENRYLVKAGLQELCNTRRPGLQAIYRLASLEGKVIDEETVAFQIAPRLNAAGRMGHASDSLRLLTTRDDIEAERLALQLEGQNRERQSLTRKAFSDAQNYVSGLESVPPFIVVESPDITPGVAGLIAGRLAEAFQRPAAALASVGEDLFVGSGRSIPGFNLIEAFNQCAELFVRHGGHSQAAGFTIRRENIPALERRLSFITQRRLGAEPPVPALDVDAEIHFKDLDSDFLSFLRQLEPFGVGNPKPVFLTRDLKVVETRKMGGDEQHLRMVVTEGRISFPALAFNQGDQWQEGTERVDLVYTVRRDTWRGKEQLNLIVEDFKPSELP